MDVRGRDGKGMDEEQRRAVLGKRNVLEWSTDCRATFTAAAGDGMRSIAKTTPLVLLSV
jgi:hypothetical protein